MIQQVLAERLPAGRRERVHCAAATALERRLGEGEWIPATRIARHFHACGRAEGDRRRSWCSRAGVEALERLDSGAARIWFTRALELTTEEDRERCRILLGLGRAERGEGNAASRETLLEATRLADRLGDVELLVEAVLANHRGFASESGTVDEERIAMLEAAIEAAGPEGGDGALLVSTLAAELAFSGELERRRELSDAALAAARKLDEPGVLARVLIQRFVTIWVPETLEIRLSDIDEAASLAAQLGDPQLQFEAIHWRSVALLQAVRLPEAQRDIARECELAERLGDPTCLWIATYDRANLEIARGRLEDAEELATEAFEIGNEGSQPDAVPFYGSQIANIRFEQGRLAELQEMLAQIVADNPGIPAFRAVLALSYSEAGLAEEARDLLALESADRFGRIPRDVTWLAGHVIYAHACAAVEHAPSAEVLLEVLPKIDDQLVYTGISVWGDLDHALGCLFRVVGRYEESEAKLRAAASLYRRAEMPVWLARCRLDLARCLLARGGDRLDEEVESLLERAADDAERLGAASVARSARSILEHARAVRLIGSPITGMRGPGVKGPSASPSAEPDYDAEDLVVREGEVWRFEHRGSSVRIRDSKGVRYVIELLRALGVEIHALDLQSGPIAAAGRAGRRGDGELAVAGSSDAGPVLDYEAKRAYRERITELEGEIEEAERFNDLERLARRREELEAIAGQLASAVGLGGRDRKAASEGERARVNVTRAIRGVLKRFAELDAGPGEHLERSIHTGSFCVYQPPRGDQTKWRIGEAKAGS